MRKRFFCIMLTLCMVLCIVPTVAFAETTSNSDDSAYRFDISALSSGSEIYFGKYSGDAISWIKQDEATSGSNSIQLHSKNILLRTVLHRTSSAAHLKNLELKETTLYTTVLPEFKNNTDNFGTIEVSMMSDLGIVSEKLDYQPTSSSDGEIPYWIAKEPFTKESVYGSFWCGYYISTSGEEKSTAVSNYDYGVIPSFKMDLSQVLFASPSKKGKQSGTVGKRALKSVSAYTKNSWKLTLKDSSRDSFTANLVSEETALDPGDTVTISYSGAVAGTNEYISGMILDKNGKVLYYGNLAEASESGTISVMIPDISVGNYTLRIFNEQINGNYVTDYSSDFVDFNISVKKDVIKPEIHFSKSVYCGAATFTVTDDVAVATVKMGNTVLTPDASGKYTIPAGSGQVIVTATDTSGNKRADVVTVNDGHTWDDSTCQQVDEKTHSQTCKYCDATEVTEHTWNDGVCTVCNYECKHKGGTATCSTLATCEICKTQYGDYNKSNHEGTESWVQTATTHKKLWSCCGTVTTAETSHDFENGTCKTCGYVCSHQGGTATCSTLATCEICKAQYGDYDKANHSNLTHVDAKAATTKSEGNIEYWYCTDCNKYFSDAACNTVISKEDTVIEKLPEPDPDPEPQPQPDDKDKDSDQDKDKENPTTGDSSNFAFWIVLLAISAGATTGTIIIRKRKID